MAARKSNPRSNAKAITRTKPKPPAKAAKTARTAKRTKSTKTKAKAAAVDTTSRFLLPERFDSSSAAEVLKSFLAHRGKPLVVDASGVRRVGAQSLQILVSASRTWNADGCQLLVENPSPELLEAASLLGLPHAELSVEGSFQ